MGFRAASPEMVTVAQDLLTQAKLMCPRFSLPVKKSERDKLAAGWARALESVAYPRWVFYEALDSFFLEYKSEDNPPTVADVLEHCKKVMQRAERDPRMSKALAQWRAERQQRRDAELNAVVERRKQEASR